MKIKELNQIQESNSIDEIDEGLKDIASKFGKGIADRVTGRGPDREQRRSTKDRESRINQTAQKAYHAWKDYEDHVAQSMAADDERHDDFLNKGPEWQEYFRRWVSKNLLPDGLPIEAMSNARDIEAAVRKLGGGAAETFRQAEISPDQYSDLAKTRRQKARDAATQRPQTAPTAAPTTAAPARQTATAPGGQFGDYRDVEDLAYDVGTGKLTPAEAQAEYKKRQQSRFPEAPPREEPGAELEAPASRFAEPVEPEPEAELEPEAPAQQPTLRDPNRASNGVERTSADPLIVKYDRHKYVVGDSGEWTKFGDKKPVDEVLQKLLDDAAEEFDENDAALSAQRAQAAPTGQWIRDPKTGQQKWQPSAATPVGQAHAAAAPKGPEQLLPGQTRNAPSPEQSAAEKEAFKRDVERNQAQGRADLERMEKEWQAQDAADIKAGITPPSRGIRKVSGHGQTAKFEPLKEGMDENIERDLFKTLVRAASLAEPAEPGEQVAAARGQQRSAPGSRSSGGSSARSQGGGGNLVQDLLHQQGIQSSPGASRTSSISQEPGAAPDMLGGLDLSHMNPRELRDYILRGMPKYHTLAEMGEFFRQAYGLETNELSSTGNATVDQLLTKMGFSV